MFIITFNDSWHIMNKCAGKFERFQKLQAHLEAKHEMAAFGPECWTVTEEAFRRRDEEDRKKKAAADSELEDLELATIDSDGQSPGRPMHEQLRSLACT